MAILKNTSINDTGYLQLPNGSTAQRPGTPLVGYTRWNTTEECVEVFDGSLWKIAGESTPSGPSIPFVTDGLQQYLDAGITQSYGGTGTTWTDLSGNNRNVVWNNVVHTSGDAGYFSTSGKTAYGPASNSFGITNTSGYTIILIFQTNTFTSNQAFKFISSVTYERGIFLHPGWANGTLYFDQGGCCNSNQRITYSTISANTWYMVGLRSNVSTRSILLNNSNVVSSTTVSAANIDLSSSAQEIGNGTEAGYDWIGKIALFATYNRAITDVEFTNNYNSIKSRFGI